LDFFFAEARMSLDRILPFAALLAASFVFVDSAYTQPRAADKPAVAASAAQAEHKGTHEMTAKEREQHRKEMHDKMHGDKANGGTDDKACMDMMDKHKKMAKDHDKAAAAADKTGACDMMKKKP
jgi:hypothetical protein